MTLNLAVLGDSIGFGLGAARPADTVGSRLVAALGAVGIDATAGVFAVSGARSDALAGQARQAVAWHAHIAVIIIGANDLIQFVPPQVAAESLRVAVRALRASGAQVVVCPAPDLSVVPWVPPAMRAMVQAASAAMRTAQTGAATAEGAEVIDAVSPASTTFSVDASLFSDDRFHPSSAGYALIASSLAPTVLAAAEGRTPSR